MRITFPTDGRAVHWREYKTDLDFVPQTGDVVRLRNGRRAWIHLVKLKNEVGDLVTFPVKGSIDMGPGKALVYEVWMKNGLRLCGTTHDRDIVELIERRGEE